MDSYSTTQYPVIEFPVKYVDLMDTEIINLIKLFSGTLEERGVLAWRQAKGVKEDNANHSSTYSLPKFKWHHLEKFREELTCLIKRTKWNYQGSLFYYYYFLKIFVTKILTRKRGGNAFCKMKKFRERKQVTTTKDL